ncbi:MAG: sulfotransferase [Anaerolineae bacterium]
MRGPDFFIVGAPKCGTTSMNDYLRQHPEIFMPAQKELHFFGTDLNSPVYVREKDKYLAYFSEACDEKRVGEASVWYLYSRRAAKEIKDFCPSASIIIMLRNPVDMLYSLHSQFLYNGNEDIKDFEAALDAEEDRKRGLRIPKSALLVEGLFYRETAKYVHQVRRYLETFGSENVHIVIYDDFKNDTSKTYRDTLYFLGVDETFKPNFRVINPNKRVRSWALHSFLWRHPEIVVRLGRALVPRPWYTRFLSAVKRWNLQYKPRPPMNPHLRRRLQLEFAPEVEMLSELLGRDLTYWCRE